jgi:DNA-binding transcriptional LysR family regulator
VELRHLEHFVAIAEERQFTRAAERLGLSQSTLSASVQALERDAGVPLFTRTTRRVELTAAGKALLPEARRTLAAAEVARASLRAVVSGAGGKVAVGTGKALPLDVGRGLARFVAEHPEVEVELRQAGSIELLEAVSDGRLDFAPLGMPGFIPEQLSRTVRIREISSEPMLLACLNSHRVAGRASVRLDEIADERFVDLPDDWAIRVLNDRAFAEIRRSRRVAFEVNDIVTLLTIVQLGMGVAIVPQSVCRRTSELTCVKLKGPAPTWRFGVAASADRPPSPAAHALLEAMMPGVEWPA